MQLYPRVAQHSPHMWVRVKSATPCSPLSSAFESAESDLQQVNFEWKIGRDQHGRQMKTYVCVTKYTMYASPALQVTSGNGMSEEKVRSIKQWIRTMNIRISYFVCVVAGDVREMTKRSKGIVNFAVLRRSLRILLAVEKNKTWVDQMTEFHCWEINTLPDWPMGVLSSYLKKCVHSVHVCEMLWENSPNVNGFHVMNNRLTG